MSQCCGFSNRPGLSCSRQARSQDFLWGGGGGGASQEPGTNNERFE